MIRRNRSILIAVVLLAVFLFSGPIQAAEKTNYSLDLFREVFQYALDKYVHELDEKTLEEMAIRGLIQQLDPYSQYFDGDDYEDFQVEMDGRFGGVGLRIEKIGDYITVVAPLSGTPGEKAGILAGDRIIKVNDTDVIGMDLQKAVSIIRGEPGTSVKLTILREGAAEPLIFNVVRSIIEIQVVESEMLEGQIGYIKLTNFTSSSTMLYTRALNGLRSDGARGIILDVRNNPGGYLGAALSVASPFIKEGGNLVHIQSRADGDNTYYSTSKALGIPLVVLVNKGSASGSEIVAGAIQDHGAGTLVGTTTFGKATVQHMHELPNGGAVKITTSQYLTPNRRQINGVGIEPDVVVEDPEEQLKTAIEILKKKIGLGAKNNTNGITFKIGEKGMWVDGRFVPLNEAPYLNRDGVTMIPLRVIAEQLDFKVNYDSKKQKITLNKGDSQLIMWVGKKEALMNGQAKSLQSVPVVKNGTSLVPLRLVAEFFGAQVEWNDGQIILK
ncbi:S41 family peptidase [Desulfitibacter alkalitolerans]|uniref:S41 family peptidase n=1 Tax=Desulfitibacter alkalitolerans TaxID=264641 RepID=UPI000683FD65|nr:S41 family peptidase [Desulfitibacter alkalitolerans]